MVVNFGVYKILCKVFRYRSKIKCILVDIAIAILITENLKKSS